MCIPSACFSGFQYQIMKNEKMQVMGNEIKQIQVPCMRVPQLEMVQKESLVQMPHTRWEEIQAELDAKSQQIEELTTR